MRILHLMLACFYIDNYKYQENLLPKCNKIDGHEVEIIASRETFVDNLNLGLTKSSRYINEDEIPVVRLKYKNNGTSLWSRKIRRYEGLYQEICRFRPDVIFCHGLQFLDLDIVIRYKRKNPDVRIYADSHESAINSGKNVISKYLLHGVIYKGKIRQAMPYLEKIYCIGVDCIPFMHEMYGIPDELLEMMPLGGIIADENIRLSKRREIRSQLGIYDDEILVLHSGKMDSHKRTLELCKAFNACKNTKFKLCIIGEFDSEYKIVVENEIGNNANIKYLGWMSGEDLNSYMMAGDLYMQPGTPSSSAQNALCAGMAIMVYPYEAYKLLFGENVFYAETISDMIELLDEIAKDKTVLLKKRELGQEFTRDNLDYMEQSRRYIQ